MKAILLIVVAGGIALAALSTVAEQEQQERRAAATPKPDLKIGSEFQDGDWQYSVRQADLSKTVTIADGSFRSTYTSNGSWVIVTIRLTNLMKSGNATLREDAFALIGDDGTVYHPRRLSRLYARDGYKELGQVFLPTVPLLAEIYFDVAPGTTGMRLYLVGPKVFIRLE